MDGVKFSSQFIEVFDYLCKKFGIAIDWSSENVLPYIQSICEKYIKWEISTSIVWLIIGIILIIIGILFIMVDAKNDWDLVGPTVIGVFFLIVGCPILFIQIFDIIKCNVFPELQIIEYIKEISSSIKN